MVAEGMFCQQLLRQYAIDNRLEKTGEIDKRLNTAAKNLVGNLPSRRDNYYYWYYGSLAMHQNQGEPWEKWNEKLRPILLDWQNTRNPKDKKIYGSWDPIGQWGPKSGRCVVTAMATLSLEVYYRYLPLSSPEWLKKGK